MCREQYSSRVSCHRSVVLPAWSRIVCARSMCDQCASYWVMPPVIEEIRASGARPWNFLSCGILESLAKCIRGVHQGQVWANSAELAYVIEALGESEPMRLVESAGGPGLSQRGHAGVRGGGGRLVQSGDRKVPGNYRQEFLVSDFR